jgi:NAD(P)-dependent dehydrogenase (short-subunit alcohol dehydrogenase family)
LSQHGIIVVSVHPGVIATDLYNHTSSAGLHLKLIWKLAACFMEGVEKGAYTQIYCCAAEGIGMADSGAYFVPVGKKEEGSKFVRDGVMKERLWEWTEEELKKLGY